MDIDRCFEILNTLVPIHCSHIGDALINLSDELDNTKVLLSKKLINAQNQDDYKTARDIIDIQEQLSHWIHKIKDTLNMAGLNNDDKYSLDNGLSKEIDGELIEIIEVDEGYEEKEQIDYSQFSVDDTVAFDIEDTTVRFKRPAGFSIGANRYSAKTWKDIIIKISELLYSKDPDIINDLIAKSRSKGKRGVYSYEKSHLRRPQKIPGTNLWVETNRSADDIRTSIIKLLRLYEVPTDTVKFYFRRDYSNLHE